MLSILIDDMKSAMKSGNKAELMALRNLIGKIKSKQIDNCKELTNEDIIKVLSSAAKQLKDSIKQYENGGREDLAKHESFELSIVEKYLPEKMTDKEISIIVKETINTSGANSMKDMGMIMGKIMQTIGAKADGSIVQKIVREQLS